jgi:hypothetical protein
MRPRRELVVYEVIAALAIAAVWGVADPGVPVIVPLVIVATASRYARGGSWSELMRGGGAHVRIGALAGLAALALALVAGTPVVEAVTDRAVVWSQYPIVRGSLQQTLGVAIVVAAAAAASELALRGWIVDRVCAPPFGGAARSGEAGPGDRICELQARPSRVMPVMIGAIAEAALAQGSVATRLGAAVFGAGLSWMFVASPGTGGRSLTAPITARVAFQLGALTLEGLRWIG